MAQSSKALPLGGVFLLGLKAAGCTGFNPRVNFAFQPSYAAHSQRDMAGKLTLAYKGVNGATAQTCPGFHFWQAQEFFLGICVWFHNVPLNAVINWEHLEQMMKADNRKAGLENMPIRF